MTWTTITEVAILGLAGSFGHCIGMCGGFAMAISRETSGAAGVFGRHVAYQTGKALTYVFLAVLLVAGLGWVGRAGWFSSAQTVMSLIAGVVMLLYGAMQLLEWRPARGVSRMLEPFPGCRALATVASRPGGLSAFVTGWLNGFLPCGLVLGALTRLAATGSTTTAATGAAVFGFATFPGLFALGLLAHAWNPRWRRLFVRVTGGILVFFGLLTIVRAFPAGRHWLMEHVVPQVEWGAIRDWCNL
jgi:sulfite exporter TauE/SafE